MRQVDILIENKKFKDINPRILGYHKCKPGYDYGKTIRDYYLIHYVKKGKGIFVAGGKKYNVSAGQIFILKKNQLGHYVASVDDPWEYIWVGFDGTFAEKINTLENQVIDFNSGIFNEMMFAKDLQNTRTEFLAGKIYEMLSFIFENNKTETGYIKQVKDYIKSSYMEQIYVENIAEKLNLNRRYLSRIFREETGSTIKGYINNVRMDKAEQLLKQNFSVSGVAQMVGYDDVFNFSKMYKKIKGVSPKNTK